MSLVKEIEENNVVLVATKKLFIEKLRFFYKTYKIGYVITSHSAYTLLDLCKKHGIANERLFILDAFTAMKDIPPKVQNCVFASSPSALTELRLAIKSFIQEMNCNMLVFDNISDLLDYNNRSDALRFLYNVIFENRSSERKIIFIEKDSKDMMHEDISMFMDRFVRV